MLGTLVDVVVMGPGDFTLGGGALLGPDDSTLGCVNVVGAIVGRDFAVIFCRVFMACIFSSPAENWDSGAVFFSASVKSSTTWSAE